MDFKKHYLDNTRFEFQRMKGLAERALEQIPAAMEICPPPVTA